MITVVLCGIVWGWCFGIQARPSSFVAACLCLSSTPLVAKFIASSEKASLDVGGKCESCTIAEVVYSHLIKKNLIS